MTTEPTDRTDDESAAAVEMLAQEAAHHEQAEEAAQEQAADAEWIDEDEAEAQAAALAKMAVQGVELAAGMIHPGHALDPNARAHGEAALLPVARDFAGELPEWLRPYMHYLGAGLWVGGVLVGAYRAKREEDAERERTEAARKASEGGADGVES